ncbi:MAG: hypothetical protein Q9212_004986, partial [Teloschistes hypoglaucus]
MANDHMDTMFPNYCTFSLLSPELIHGILTRGHLDMYIMSQGAYRSMPQQEKLNFYMHTLSQSPQTTPEFFNVANGQGVWRVPATINPDATKVPSAAMVRRILDLQPRWTIFGVGSGRFKFDMILRGPLTEIELHDVRNGRFPPTLAELGIPAPGVCGGTSIMPGRPRQLMMDPEPTPPRPRTQRTQGPVYDTPRRALNLSRSPTRQPRPQTFSPPPQPTRTRPRRPPPTLMRLPSPSSSSSSSSSDSSDDDSSEEEKPKKVKKTSKKKNKAVDKKGKAKAKAPAKRRPARDDDDDDEVIAPSRAARARPSRQAPPAPGRARRVERFDNEREDTAPAPRPPARRQHVGNPPPPKSQR